MFTTYFGIHLVWQCINFNNSSRINLIVTSFSVMIYVLFLAVKTDFFFFLLICLFSLPDLIFSYSTEDPAEKERIQQSAECCRKILNHVNEEVKVMENLLVRRDPLSNSWCLAKFFLRELRASSVFDPPSSDSEGIPAQIGHIGTETQ